jgi:YfiH family protein
MMCPDWPVPATVKAVTTTRAGGVSVPPYNSFNLADHVGDAEPAVRENRLLLRQRLHLPAEPLWLQQVHGDQVVAADSSAPRPCADAAYTCARATVCAVLSADCLPVLFCDRRGTRVAAAHAGWRGLACGVLERTVAALGVAPDQLLAWLGPAIGPHAFQVGAEVRDAFVGQHVEARAAFVTQSDGRWLADLYRLARIRLGALGVKAVYGGSLCTFSEPERFYSYRRDGVTGRMASLIWLD